MNSFEYVGICNTCDNREIRIFHSTPATRAVQASFPWLATPQGDESVIVATKERDAAVDIICQHLDLVNDIPKYVQLAECDAAGLPISEVPSVFWVVEKDGAFALKKISQEELLERRGFGRGWVSKLVKALEATRDGDGSKTVELLANL